MSLVGSNNKSNAKIWKKVKFAKSKCRCKIQRNNSNFKARDISLFCNGPHSCERLHISFMS